MSQDAAAQYRRPRSRDVARGILIAEEVGSKRAGLRHLALAGAADFAAHFSDWKVAARLRGAFEALSQEMGNQPEPSDEAIHERFIARQ